jgi:multidrug efflux system outer membrane protein
MKTIQRYFRLHWVLLAAAIGCQWSALNRARPPQAVGSLPAARAGAEAPSDAHFDNTTAATGKTAASEIVLTAAQSAGGAAPEATKDSLAENVQTPVAAMPAAPPAMTLSEALATSLMQNPDLATARGTANVGAAVIDVARVYPWNPFVQAQYLPTGHPFVPATTPGSQAGGANYYIWLMQRFELGHQRRYREEGAIAAFGQTRWNIRQAELVNVAQTERLFFAALYQRQLRDLAADTETLSQRLVGVVSRRFQAGIATAIEMANAKIAARQSHRQAQLAESGYQAALLALKQQLALPTDTPLHLAGDLTRFDWQPVSEVFCWVSQSSSIDARVLATELAEARPDVMAARSGAAIARANLNLARAARTPDVQGGPIYSTADNGTNYLGFRLQRDIGIWNNGSALAGQRESELNQQILAHAQLLRRATGEAAAAVDRYERARLFVAEAHADRSQPGDELQQVLSQFEAGKADIVNVLGIQNNLLTDLRAELDLQNEVAQAAANVTQATGLPPERLLAPPRPEALPATDVETPVPPAPVPPAPEQ